MKRFNQIDLAHELSRISARAMTVFACSCAERVFAPLYEYLKIGDAEKATFARNKLDQIWNAVLQDIPLDWSDSVSENILALVPQKADEAHLELWIWAENSVAAIVYASLTVKTGDPNNAAWAAGRAYEVSFYAAEDQIGSNQLDLIDASSLVQLELERQSKDLEMLGKSDSPSTYRKLRTLAQSVDAILELRGRPKPN